MRRAAPALTCEHQPGPRTRSSPLVVVERAGCALLMVGVLPIAPPPPPEGSGVECPLAGRPCTRPLACPACRWEGQAQLESSTGTSASSLCSQHMWRLAETRAHLFATGVAHCRIVAVPRKSAEYIGSMTRNLRHYSSALAISDYLPK